MSKRELIWDIQKLKRGKIGIDQGKDYLLTHIKKGIKWGKISLKWILA